MNRSFIFNETKCINQTIPRGIYRVEMWGAQGGQCKTEIPYGGYVGGILYFRNFITLEFCVGGKGKAGNTSEVIEGGFNGGGKAKIGSEKICGGSGGGATEIRYPANPNTRIMVAGGAGGDGDSGRGGFGGGKEGGDGNGNYGGKGGNQTSVGIGGIYPGTNKFVPCSGTSGNGKNGGDANTTAWGSAGGGGAGYFGGGAGADNSGGGGGSSYFSSSVINGTTKYGNRAGDGYIIMTMIGYIDKTYSIQPFLPRALFFICILTKRS